MTIDDNKWKFEPRPLIHFSPSAGFMNDPNGLVYSKGVWHLYFQLDEQRIVAGHPEWGHATSNDLIHWVQHGKSIKAPSDKESIFSGCCVVDSNNTSGLFDNSIDQQDRLVAIYTLHSEGLETQCIAYSTDGGYKFTTYINNPVLDIKWADFRDPKVVWHEPSSQWVMVVAKCRQFRIGFYGSPDLKNWVHLSDFEGAGVRGYQYEVPNLVEIPFDHDHQQKKWVLLVSISPGAPLGGSFTQYFIGSFDGTRFSADDNYLRTADFGNDWYAAQTWFNSSDEQVYGIGWASNWKYGQNIPTKSYRSAMSLVRKFSLREVALNDTVKSLSLISRPVGLANCHSTTTNNNYNEKNFVGESFSESIANIPDRITINSVYQERFKGSAFEFKLNIASRPSDSAVSTAAVTAEILNFKDQSIHINFLVDEQGMYCVIDRGSIRTGCTWEHPLFEDKVCMWVPNTQTIYDIQIIIDEYLCEIFVNDGSYSFTNSFFLEDGSPSRISVSHSGVLTEIYDVYELF